MLVATALPPDEIVVTLASVVTGIAEFATETAELADDAAEDAELEAAEETDDARLPKTVVAPKLLAELPLAEAEAAKMLEKVLL